MDNEARPEGFGYTAVENTVFFYADNLIFASLNMMWLHHAFDVVIDLFGQIDLQTNVAKTVKLVCHTGAIAGH